MRKAVMLSVPLLLALFGYAPGAGLLVPRSGEAPIQIHSHRVSATFEDGIARTTVRQTFVNPHSRALEAIYLFPLPEGAALTEVAMEVGGKRLEGLLAERKRARRVYDTIVRSQRDPALVEQIGRSKFRLSVFPVVPKVETVVEITYIERVPLARGRFRYVYPLALGGKASRTEKDFTFSLILKSSVRLETVTSSVADMAITRRGPGEYTASLERTGVALDRDLAVEAALARERSAVAVKTFRGDRGHGWFLLLVTPPPVSEDHLVPRDVILAIDTSGSMKGKKIDQAKASAHYLLENLRPVDRVNVLAFSSSVEPFAAEPVPATPGNLGKIRKFVAGIKAMGGTAIADALKEALDVKKTEGRVRTVVFLTDGCPTVGEIRPEEIVKMARAGRASGLRVFPFGVGEDVDAGLLGGIAEATRGRAEIFRPGGEIETRLRRFLDRTSAPVLAGLTVSVPGSRDVFPRPLPDVYLGEQVAVVGRYIEGGLREIRVSATAGTRKTCLTTVADFQAAPGGSTAVRDLFARMKLDFLERQLRLRGGLSDDAYYAALDRGAYSTEDEITGEIISVSLEHGVQSAYTSFLALLPEDRHRIDPRDADALRKALARVARVRGKVARASQPVEEESIQEEEPIEEAEIVDEFVEEMELEDDTVAEQSFEARYSKAAIGLGSAAGGYLGGRRGAQRGLRRRYRGQGTATGVDMGLAWLARAQQPDGSWPQTSCTTANTGLALLAFLGAGHTHQAGSHKQVLGSGLKYLRRIQDAEGCFGGRKDLRAHAIATLAVAEAYCLTHSPLLRRCVEKGIDYLVRTTLPPGDSHATVWAVLAFVAARDAGIPLKKEVFDRARTRLDSINSREDAIGAAVVFARILLGENPDTSERIQRGVKRLLEALARHEAALATRREVEFWYFGTFAMFQVGGSKWGRFNRSMKAAIVDSQEKTGDRKGAWVPTGSRAATLGPVGSTALFTMCLEVYFRYGRVFGTR